MHWCWRFTVGPLHLTVNNLSSSAPSHALALRASAFAFLPLFLIPSGACPRIPLAGMWHVALVVYTTTARATSLILIVAIDTMAEPSLLAAKPIVSAIPLSKARSIALAFGVMTSGHGRRGRPSTALLVGDAIYLS